MSCTFRFVYFKKYKNLVHSNYKQAIKEVLVSHQCTYRSVDVYDKNVKLLFYSLFAVHYIIIIYFMYIYQSGFSTSLITLHFM